MSLLSGTVCSQVRQEVHAWHAMLLVQDFADLTVIVLQNGRELIAETQLLLAQDKAADL